MLHPLAMKEIAEVQVSFNYARVILAPAIDYGIPNFMAKTANGNGSTSGLNSGRV
jgi:hypothetical protein